MKCPYCGSEMKEGVISGDCREKICRKEGDYSSTTWERFRGKGEL